MWDANVTHPVGSTSKACEGPAISASVSVSSSSSSVMCTSQERGLLVSCCMSSVVYVVPLGGSVACWADCDLLHFCKMLDDPALVPLSSFFHHVRLMTPRSKWCRSSLELCPWFVWCCFFGVKEVEEDHMRWPSFCATCIICLWQGDSHTRLKGQKTESSRSNEFFKEFVSLWTHIIFFIFPYITHT